MKRTAFSPHTDIYVNHLKSTLPHNMSVQHYHDAYELYLQLDGTRRLFFDNTCYTLTKGDLAVIMPFDIHCAENIDSSVYERYIVNFRTNALLSVLTADEIHLLENKLKPCIVHLDEKSEKQLRSMFEFVEQCDKKSGFLCEKLKSSALLHLISTSAEHIVDTVAVSANKIPSEIVSAISYINSHYSSKISLEKIAKSVCMSKFHFSRKFKQTTGSTVFEYITNLRLSKAHGLLLSSDNTIDEISQILGFSSAMQFSRTFKSIYGVSPSVFRKQKKI